MTAVKAQLRVVPGYVTEKMQSEPDLGPFQWLGKGKGLAKIGESCSLLIESVRREISVGVGHRRSR